MRALSKLRALEKYFKLLNVCDEAKLFSYAENLKTLTASPFVDFLGSDDMRRLVLCQYEYDAVVEIEDCHAQAELIIAAQAMCLDAIGDCNRDGMAEPESDITVEDDESGAFSYQYRVRLREQITAVPDEQGKILWDDTRWTFEVRDVVIAEDYLLLAELAP